MPSGLAASAAFGFAPASTFGSVTGFSATFRSPSPCYAVTFALFF